jgi:hypothetical protein
MNASEFLAMLRQESGQDEGCPACGSAGDHWDDDSGVCIDCGFDLHREAIAADFNPDLVEWEVP